jgi:hypothetical protein
MLKKEFEYFLEHQDELVEKYDGKFIVISQQRVIGVYDTDEQALFETKKTHALGSFLIQKCISGKEAYTQTFHSRVSFV